MALQRHLRVAAQAIKQADAIYITAGAGAGVDSGLPDFRGTEGLWREYPPLAKMNLSFADMANPEWFENDLTFAWGFYGHRLNLYRRIIPHDGFTILNRWSQQRKHGCFVFTSNVDGQFQKAGFTNVLECHGSIHHLQPLMANGEILDAANYILPEVEPATLRLPLEAVPRDSGGQVLRPNILMFNDWGWDEGRTRKQHVRHAAWTHKLVNGDTDQSGAVVVIELGAGTAVPTVRRTSEQFARKFCCPLIRINLRESHIPPDINSVPVPMGCLDALKTLDELLGSE